MTDTTKDDTTQSFTLRMRASQVAAIDQRAASVKMSRNAWLVKALGYVLMELPTGATVKERLAMRDHWQSGDI